MLSDIKFVHPKDMQDGKVDISPKDITTNLPWVPGAHLAFDHHLSETIRNTGERKNHVIDADAPSAQPAGDGLVGVHARLVEPFLQLVVLGDQLVHRRPRLGRCRRCRRRHRGGRINRRSSHSDRIRHPRRHRRARGRSIRRRRRRGRRG